VNNTVVLDGPQTEYIFKNIFNEGKVDLENYLNPNKNKEET